MKHCRCSRGPGSSNVAGLRKAAGLRHGSVVTALPALWGIGSGRAVTARVRGAARNTRPFVSIFLTGGGPGRREAALRHGSIRARAAGHPLPRRTAGRGHAIISDVIIFQRLPPECEAPSGSLTTNPPWEGERWLIPTCATFATSPCQRR